MSWKMKRLTRRHPRDGHRRVIALIVRRGRSANFRQVRTFWRAQLDRQTPTVWRGGLPVRYVWNPFGREKLLEGGWLETGTQSAGVCPLELDIWQR